MAITGRPRPLPECRKCRDPLPRDVARTRLVCASCATPAERMRATHVAAHLAKLPHTSRRETDARIERLAARRAAREARTA